METKSPVDKAALLFKMFIWMQVLIITVAFCIPGIIISLQYSKDPCVVGKQWNIRLDEWLLISALMHLLSLISFLPSICCVWRNICSKIVPLILVTVLGLWGVLGAYVMTVSNLTDCDHDSLWVMSIIEIVFIGIFILVYCIVQFYSCCSCSKSCSAKFCGWCAQSESLSESLTDDEEVIEWLRKTGINTFAPLSNNTDNNV
jgi:hypothetical protein